MKVRTLLVSMGALVSALVLGVGAADAAVVPLTATPSLNALTFTFTNNDYDATSCAAQASGPVYFDTITLRVPPRSTATVTYTDVPGGGYSVSWGCQSFSMGKQWVVVPGGSLPGSKPHQGPAYQKTPPQRQSDPSTGLGGMIPTGSFGS